jgi:hypothetical protein
MATAGTTAGMIHGIPVGMIRGIMADITIIGDHLIVMVDIMADTTAVDMDTGTEDQKVRVTTMAEGQHQAFPTQETVDMAEAVPELTQPVQQRRADTALPVTVTLAEAADTQLYRLHAVLPTCIIIAMEDAQAVTLLQPITTV